MVMALHGQCIRLALGHMTKVMGHTTRVMACITKGIAGTTGFMGYTTRDGVLGITRSKMPNRPQCIFIKGQIEVGKGMIYGGRQSRVVAILVWTMVIQRMDYRTKHRIPMLKGAECDKRDKKVKHDAIWI